MVADDGGGVAEKVVERRVVVIVRRKRVDVCMNIEGIFEVNIACMCIVGEIDGCV